jgi:hypothetical protein
MAASLGFEPRQRDPESLVLPLHYEAKTIDQVQNSTGCASRTQPAQHRDDRHQRCRLQLDARTRTQAMESLP